jgi:hypothetical protein
MIDDGMDAWMHGDYMWLMTAVLRLVFRFSPSGSEERSSSPHPQVLCSNEQSARGVPFLNLYSRLDVLTM